eukprot:4172669-Prymnesium_polylepis.1
MTAATSCPARGESTARRAGAQGGEGGEGPGAGGPAAGAQGRDEGGGVQQPLHGGSGEGRWRLS